MEWETKAFSEFPDQASGMFPCGEGGWAVAEQSAAAWRNLWWDFSCAGGAMSSSHQGSFGRDGAVRPKRAGAWHGSVWHCSHYSHLSLPGFIFWLLHCKVPQPSQRGTGHQTFPPPIEARESSACLNSDGFTNQHQVLHLPVICTCLMVIKSTGVILFV